MQISKRILFVVLFCFPLLSRAEERCLWLNAATAGGVLDGMVDLRVTKLTAGSPSVQTANARSSAGPMSASAAATPYSDAGMDDAECIFSRTPSAAGQMRVQVRTMGDPAKVFQSYAKRCGARGTPVKAIGNEAVLCDSKTGGAEKVIGRVRDRLFVVELSLADPSVTPAALRDKAQSTARIVAGNLF